MKTLLLLKLLLMQKADCMLKQLLKLNSQAESRLIPHLCGILRARHFSRGFHTMCETREMKHFLPDFHTKCEIMNYFVKYTLTTHTINKSIFTRKFAVNYFPERPLIHKFIK